MQNDTDILVVGGGLGGVAAALSAAKMGFKVILTEETDWLGGQLTSQMVPMDEHPWIESFGCTDSYRKLRDGIRDYYRAYYPLTAKARSTPNLNPGAALVTRLACEPKVAIAVIDQLLAPYTAAGRIQVLLNHKPIHVETVGDSVASVSFEDTSTGEQTTYSAAFILDATETGDLLALGDIEHVTGAESQAQTGELHAIQGEAQPLNMQSITTCFALSYHPNEDHTIDKPEQYDFWKQYQAEFEVSPHFSYKPRKNSDFSLFPEPGKFSLWQFRRILYKNHFMPGFFDSDLTIINCMHNDYWLGPVFGLDEIAHKEHLEASRQLSLSFLYWLQKEAPRPDGRQGYAGLKLRPDVAGTADGLAKYPYIRESRRIQALFTVTEQHVGVEAREGQDRAAIFEDSVGIGSYRIDLHPTTDGDPSLNIPAYPFQIPLGAMIPVRVENLLPAAKNIGTTHITNGCYRLHQIEWNIGEAAGLLAAFCLNKGLKPRQAREQAHLGDYQALLRKQGIALEWPQFMEGTSYHKAHVNLPDWHWGETDKMENPWLYA
ncbi:FAD-dependent oxidoreductase [Phototrophicus methaneseepsis]|uniref:FAD-dependent oxidoreductase n=1 Tax=Phototrophicus methaneseepsis TaxID=2710758 RepID=A0A7S8E528_9CHLR|nr:FAD-dependent oxidoreductase [Phototrophicus methaneseepsis]QPC80523.1 FAD-dependent oxidoreductase [Phototrophicus methaneseepsis]